MLQIEKVFTNQSKLTFYVGAIRQTVEQLTNHLLNSIHNYCRENEISLEEMFTSNEEKNISNSTITSAQFQEGLKKAKIPFPVAQIEKIIKYLVGLYKD